ncbi:efflux RND transporter periplasmic adaptor subunit [Streptomyces sp. NRRL F-5126]|uniref:efflux RND transporter periplasmic adaptor subunit n=1 Tax=Streptomyces sp. NRRL F-5126 TaxID=1463857 RepID=UPI00055ED5FB|nr:peptidoglycan-binding protein [Streptomyces sp. NRRL F-5126]
MISDIPKAGTGTETGPGVAGTRKRRRRATPWIAGLAITAALVGGGAAVVHATTGDKPAPRSEPDASTAPIEYGRLSATVKATGSLAFAGAHDIGSGVSGILTGAPAPGTTVRRGKALFSVDDVPVFLFHGDKPAWRAFMSGMDDGPDVKQLEQNLKALGHFSGKPDEEFTWRTKAAVIAWQKATGQKQTGNVDLGRVVFEHGDERVQSVKTRIGSPVGAGAVLSVTEPDKQVSVDLDLADQQLAVVGRKVGITLPGGSRTSGKIVSVGTPHEADPKAGKVTIPVAISLHDPAAAASLQQASVTVDFPSASRENVLSVPVGALMAFSESRFGVEVLQRDGTIKRVPVKTGLFAGGFVEISGGGLRAGQKVVVPKL